MRKETEMLRAFKKRARLFIQDPPQYSDNWQWLALARHAGLPTRLLDWSESAGVAVYFAVRKRRQDPIDSALWCSKKPQAVTTDKDEPFTLPDIRLYEPPHVAHRLFVQRSVFTVHPTEYKDKEVKWPGMHIKVIIPAALREPLRCLLADLGIDHASLCPEPEAIASALVEQYW